MENKVNIIKNVDTQILSIEFETSEKHVGDRLLFYKQNLLVKLI